MRLSMLAAVETILWVGLIVLGYVLHQVFDRNLVLLCNQLLITRSSNVAKSIRGFRIRFQAVTPAF
jgi:ABC-type iron transport system FetAB permease component